MEAVRRAGSSLRSTRRSRDRLRRAARDEIVFQGDLSVAIHVGDDRVWAEVVEECQHGAITCGNGVFSARLEGDGDPGAADPPPPGEIECKRSAEDEELAYDLERNPAYLCDGAGGRRESQEASTPDKLEQRRAERSRPAARRKLHPFVRALHDHPEAEENEPPERPGPQRLHGRAVPGPETLNRSPGDERYSAKPS